MVAEHERAAEKSSESPSVYLSVKQVAERLDITPAQVYELCSARMIGFMRFGKRKGMRFTEDQVADFIKRSTVAPKAVAKK